MKEKLSLLHGFLQADAQNDLSELETKFKKEELSEVNWCSGLNRYWGSCLSFRMQCPRRCGEIFCFLFCNEIPMALKYNLQFENNNCWN